MAIFKIRPNVIIRDNKPNSNDSTRNQKKNPAKQQTEKITWIQERLNLLQEIFDITDGIITEWKSESKGHYYLEKEKYVTKTIEQKYTLVDKNDIDICSITSYLICFRFKRKFLISIHHVMIVFPNKDNKVIFCGLIKKQKNNEHADIIENSHGMIDIASLQVKGSNETIIEHFDDLDEKELDEIKIFKEAYEQVIEFLKKEFEIDLIGEN